MRLKHFFAMAALFLCSLHLPLAHAQEDLSALNGLWVVDYGKTKALWEASRADMNSLPLLAVLFKLDMNFSDATMLAGASFSKEPQRMPFTVTHNKNGNLHIVVTKGAEPRILIWQTRDDGTISLNVGKTSPIIMMRCDYAKYAGTWALDMPANEPLLAMMADNAKKDSPDKMRARLGEARMSLQFSDGNFRMDWHDKQGNRIYRPFPSGLFGVVQYGKEGCTVSQGGRDIAISFKNQNYMVLSAKNSDFRLYLKRTP